MINTEFIVSTDMEEFNDYADLQIYPNAKGGISVTSKNDDIGAPWIVLAPDMIEDFITALHALQVQYPHLRAGKEVGNE